jgi:hypothetical protein
MKTHLQHSFLAIVLLVGVAASLVAQPMFPSPADTLATVGRDVITAAEFLTRFELMPWEDKDKPREQDSAKIRALHSLVAERLLAFDALRRGIGEDPETVLMKKTLEKLLVKDELYRREVLGRVSVSEEEIKQGMDRFARELRVDVAASPSRSASEKLSRLLRSGLAADTLPAFAAAFMTARETVTVNFGGLDPGFEEIAYDLAPGQWSEPFRSVAYGWVLVNVVDRRPNKDFAEMTPQERRRTVVNVLARRREDTLAGRYYGELLRGRRAESDSAAFRLMSGELLSLMRGNARERLRAGVYPLAPDDIDRLLERLSARLEMTAVRMEGGDLTVGEVLEAMRYERWSFSSLDPDRFAASFHRHLKKIVEGEYVAREGYRQQLQWSRSVQKDVAVWSSYWGARMNVRRILDAVSLSEEEVLRYGAEHAATFAQNWEVNVREVLCGNADTALWIREEIEKGSDMADLARRFSRRASWGARGGESGYFAVEQHPEIGIAAIFSDSGSLVGPLSTSEGLSVFRVLGRRFMGEENGRTEEVIGRVRSAAHRQSAGQQLNRVVAGLAREFGVSIRYDALRNVPLGSVQMFTRRFLGFGGVMTAVPMVYPIQTWVKEWTEGEGKLP